MDHSLDVQNTYSSVSKYVREKVESSTLIETPYPHLSITNIFPQPLYNQILDHRIEDDCLQTLRELKRVGSGYPDSRKVLSLTSKMFILSDNQRQFWEPFAAWMQSDFKQIILEKFKPYILKRFNIIPNLSSETLYTRDKKSYELNPHTDSQRKVITLLIYLPKTSNFKHVGTSMYIPIDPSFTCDGGPHYPRKKFNHYKLAGYEPNCMFGFFKTNNSFHGVEPILDDFERDLLIYDIFSPQEK